MRTGGLEQVFDVVVELPAPASRRRRRPSVLVALVVLAGALFLGYGSGTIWAPFGDSHDGRNAGVWGLGARALHDDGPAASRIGTRSAEFGTYANHPPLIAVETAVAAALAGDTPAATRAPAWLGSVIALGLLAALLRERGLHAAAVGAAVVLVAATPMFLVFGTMLDTPVTSLPIGLALLLLWERARQGRPVHWMPAAGVAALAVLAGWQSLLVAGIVAVWALARRTPAFVAGALGGSAVLVGWMWWAHGGTLRPLAAVSLARSSGRSAPLGDVLSQVLAGSRALLGAVALVGALGLLVALSRPATRGLAAVALAVTVPYPFLFRDGAMNHEYWNYWFLLPLAIGLAAGGDWVLSVVRVRWRADVGLAVLATALAAVSAAGLWANPNAPAWATEEGARAGAAAGAGGLPPGQTVAWFAGAVGRPPSWLSLATRLPALPADAARLAAERPGDLIFVGRGRCADGAPRISYAWEAPASVLVDPPDVSFCR